MKKKSALFLLLIGGTMLAIYSNTSWKCRQQERANKISTSSATNIHYKQT